MAKTALGHQKIAKKWQNRGFTRPGDGHGQKETVVGCSTSNDSTQTAHRQSVTHNDSPQTVIVTNYFTVTNYVSQPAPLEDFTNRYGLSLRDAQDKALQLTPGMTQGEVTLLLGKPDETSSGTYGTQTTQPWIGITWLYQWAKPLKANETLSDLVEAGQNSKRFSVIFANVRGAWVVSSWQWH